MLKRFRLTSDGSLYFAVKIGTVLTFEYESTSAYLVTLQGDGIRTHLETSGAHPLSGDWDWITLSPKPHREPKGMVVKICDEVKVIIEGESDIEWAESFKEQASTRPGPGNCLGARHFYLQPEWLKKDSAIPLIVEHVLKNPQWQISLQTHKFLGIR